MLLSEQECRRKQILAEKAKKERERWARQNPERVIRMRGVEGKGKCLICLFKCGLGKHRIGRLLNTSTGFVRLRTRRLSKLDRTFIHHRKAKKPRTYRSALKEMRVRVRSCLNKKPPSQVAGMSDADAFRWRYRNDPAFRLMQLCRRRTRKLLAGVKRSGSCTKLVGCSSEHLRLHIQRQFKRGMNWNNYGKWHLDHIIPCAHFDLTREDQQRICFHWTNLQPLWSQDNQRKRDRLEKHETPQFAF